MNRNMLRLVGSLAALLLVACVEAPGAKDGGALWNQYADESSMPDKDVAVTDTAVPADGDTPPVDDDILDLSDTDGSESPDADVFVCMGDPCTTHDDCKKPSCVATFCTAVLGALTPNNPNVCAMRCDPANNGAECPDGMTCNDQIQAAAGLGIDIDGAKGICAPPTR